MNKLNFVQWTLIAGRVTAHRSTQPAAATAIFTWMAVGRDTPLRAKNEFADMDS